MNNEKERRPWEDPRLDPRQRNFLEMMASMPRPRPKKLSEMKRSHAEMVKRATSSKALAIQRVIEARMLRETKLHLLLAPREGVTVREGVFESAPEGNRVRFLFFSPSRAQSRLPCVYYIHGGGMIAGSIYYAHYRAWARLIAHHGVCVMLVEFRNALNRSLADGQDSSGEVAAYPGGLNDCVSGLRWLVKNASEFGIDTKRVIIAGESGGGNLAIATALKLKRAGESSFISGLYAMCPYIVGNYPDTRFPSTVKSNGILIHLDGSAPAAYGIGAYAARDPCAWPAFASAEDLREIAPRVFVSLNECDPLHDEGLDFYRNLLRAGVKAQCRVVVGTAHGAELFMFMPDVSRQTAASIAGFAVGERPGANLRAAL